MPRGNSIAGKVIQINLCRSRRSKETLISVLVSDTSASDAQVEHLRAAIDDGRQIIKAKEQEIALLKLDVEFAKYLVLAKQMHQ